MNLRARLITTTIAITTIAGPSHAQSAGDGFLFKVPTGSWTLRAGVDHALAGSDIYTFVTRQLTLKRNDFSSATFGTNFAFRMSPVAVTVPSRAIDTRNGAMLPPVRPNANDA